jgi:cystathionine gamma-synthase
MSQNIDWNKLATESQVVAAGRPEKKPDGALNPPIALNSTFHEGGPIGYGRYGNEAWSALEEAISILEGGQTLIFSSGMAAISAALSLLPPGSTIIAAENGYQGTTTMLKKMHEHKQLNVRFVNLPDTEQVLKALPGANMLYLESPTNPAIEVVDLPKVISAGKKEGCLVVVDNTLATPMVQNPLQLGADICVHSVTKYLSGHSDILLGCAVVKDTSLLDRLEQSRRYGGAIAGPFEAWLALRGVRTFALRMQRSQENAMELAKRLEKDKRVSKVRFPGLPSDPYHERAKSFMKGFGAMISFEVKAEVSQIENMCNSSKLITNATSLGGVESIWERRRRWATESHTIPENLIRFSVGIENVEDLWADIQDSFSAAGIN